MPGADEPQVLALEGLPPAAVTVLVRQHSWMPQRPECQRFNALRLVVVLLQGCSQRSLLVPASAAYLQVLVRMSVAL